MKYIIDENTISGIANSIRSKKGTTDKIKTENFASEISTIETSENLDTELNAQDTAINNQTTKVDDIITALDNIGENEFNAKVDYTIHNMGTYLDAIYEKITKLNLPDLYFNGNVSTTMGNPKRLFTGLTHLQSIDLSKIHIQEGATDMQSMFSTCRIISALDLSGFNTSTVTNMYALFSGCSNLSSINLNGLNTSKVTGMGNMFYSCEKLTKIDISHFDMSKVTSMDYMFSRCFELVDLVLPETFGLYGEGLQGLTNTSNLFSSCKKLKTINGVLNLSKITYAYNMFDYCTDLENVSIKNLNYSGLSFSTCTSLSHDSLKYMIDNLVSTTTTKRLTLGSTNLAKLTTEEIAVGTAKGWTIS